MPCQELERLEKRKVEVHAEQGNVEIPERKRLILQDDERSIHMAIANHKSFGYGGRPCPCKKTCCHNAPPLQDSPLGMRF